MSEMVFEQLFEDGGKVCRLPFWTWIKFGENDFELYGDSGVMKWERTSCTGHRSAIIQKFRPLGKKVLLTLDKKIV